MDNTAKKEIDMIVTPEDLKKVLNDKKTATVLAKSGDETWRKLFGRKEFFKHLISMMDFEFIIKKLKRVGTKEQIWRYSMIVLRICIESGDRRIFDEWNRTFNNIPVETFNDLIRGTPINEDFVKILDFADMFFEDIDDKKQVCYSILNTITILFEQRERRESNDVNFALRIFKIISLNYDLEKGLLMVFYAMFGMIKEFDTLRERFFGDQHIDVNDVYLIDTTGKDNRHYFYSTALEKLEWPEKYFAFFYDKTFFHVIMSSDNDRLIDDYSRNLSFDEVSDYFKIYNSDRIVKNYLRASLRNNNNPFEALVKEGDLKEIYDDMMISTGAKFQTNNDLFIRLITAIAYLNQEPLNFKKLQMMLDNPIYIEDTARFINQSYNDHRRYIIYYVINNKSLSKLNNVHDINSILDEYIRFNMKKIENYANSKGLRITNGSNIEKVDKIISAIQTREVVDTLDSLIPMVSDKTMKTLLIIYSIKYDTIVEDGRFLQYEERARQLLLRNYNMVKRLLVVNDETSSDDESLEREFSYDNGSENDYTPVIDTRSRMDIIMDRQRQMREDRKLFEVVKQQREEEQKKLRKEAIIKEKADLQKQKEIEKLRAERQRITEENLRKKELEKKRLLISRDGNMMAADDITSERIRQRRVKYVRENSEDDDMPMYATDQESRRTGARSSSASSADSGFINSSMPSRPAYGGQQTNRSRSNNRPVLLGSNQRNLPTVVQEENVNQRPMLGNNRRRQ